MSAAENRMPDYPEELEPNSARADEGKARKSADAKAMNAWPEPLAEEAFHGLAGDFVRAIGPHTESDPAALLLQYLTAFGNAVGRGPHFTAEADRHGANLNMVLVGQSSRGGKGTSKGQVLRTYAAADEDWFKGHIAGGLSSGEGLIWAVRDPIEKQEPIRKGRGAGAKVIGYQTVTSDPGVDDKRLLVTESEFASTLRVIGRDGNTLSPIVRQAWDSGHLRTLTKNNPAKATDAHISIIGHITRDELRRYLDSTEAGNGFANRFLWICVKRSKLLPDGGNVKAADREALARKTRTAITKARGLGELRRDDGAREIWHRVYEGLTEETPGMLGAITARSAPQTMRLALIYALLDGDTSIRAEHLDAAIAVWEYAAASARYIFGDALGDPIADTILGALRRNKGGLTRTEIGRTFGNHKKPERIELALTMLGDRGLARVVKETTGGRTAERWFAAGGK